MNAVSTARASTKGAMALGAVLFMTSIGGGSGCSSRSVSVGVDDGSRDPGPLSPPVDGGSVDASLQRLMCPTSACSAPYITCPGSKFACDVDTASDNDNCGRCGNVCPSGDDVAVLFGGRFYCAGGACRLTCDPGWGDCNGDPTDGCENPMSCDAENCGACGKKCAPGETCHEGECGCPSGLKECSRQCSVVNSCFDIKKNDLHCGDCGIACEGAGTLGDAQLHLRCGCVNGMCNRRKCGGFGGNWADCNNPSSPQECIVLPEEDGCEVDLDRDEKNCGACGRACAPGQVCSKGNCLCEPPFTLCSGECVDLSSDPVNCGGCARRCPGGSSEGVPAHGVPICDQGQCGFACNPRFADCDEDRTNGCETPLDSDPNNCGRCGTRCNSAAAQPCIGGRCAVVECPPGTGPVQ